MFAALLDVRCFGFVCVLFAMCALFAVCALGKKSLLFLTPPLGEDFSKEMKCLLLFWG